MRIATAKGLHMLESKPEDKEIPSRARWAWCGRSCTGCDACLVGMPRGHWWTSREAAVIDLVRACRRAGRAIEIGDDGLRARVDAAIAEAARQQALFHEED